MEIEIKNRYTCEVIYRHDCEDNTIAKTVMAAIAAGVSLCDADLCDADLCDADLCDADLCDADLCDADLRNANFCGADLCNADLCNANFCGADLCNADLCNADLCNANFCGADLRVANLCDANLRGANLRGANLYGADLRGADLRDADLRGAKGLYMACPTDGAFVAWKRAGDHIVKLRVADDARRSSATCNKCRCDKAEVLDIQNEDGTPSGLEVIHSDHDENFIYVVGATVEVPDFDENRFNKCTTGIHFFVDRRAAVEYKG